MHLHGLAHSKTKRSKVPFWFSASSSGAFNPNKATSIFDFDFENNVADPVQLMTAWLPEIEQAANEQIADDRITAFLLGGLQLVVKSGGLHNLNLKAITDRSGYSRSTFFRIFESYTGFLLRSYQLTCLLSTKVYRKHLYSQALDVEQFCKFTADVFYGANCTVPHELVRDLWQTHNASHSDFHPHISGLAADVRQYLQQNRPTQHLEIDLEELTYVLRSLDLAILTARIEDDERWGTPFYYKKLRKLLMGYLNANS